MYGDCVGIGGGGIVLESGLGMDSVEGDCVTEGRLDAARMVISAISGSRRSLGCGGGWDGMSYYSLGTI